MWLKKSGQNFEVHKLPLGGTGMLQWPGDPEAALSQHGHLFSSTSHCLHIWLHPFSSDLMVFNGFRGNYHFQWFNDFASMTPTLIFICSKQLHLRKKYFRNIDIPQLHILQVSATGLKLGESINVGMDFGTLQAIPKLSDVE